MIAGPAFSTAYIYICQFFIRQIVIQNNKMEDCRKIERVQNKKM